MKSKPNYFLHEDRYLARCEKPDVYSGWFTAKDYEEGIQEIRELLALGFAPERGALIDLGCGAGNYSLKLASLGYDVTGVGISQTAIDWANEHVAKGEVKASFVCGDGIAPDDFENESMDFAFDGHFFHCIIGED